MRKTVDKQVLKFLSYLRHLEVIEAIGIARILKVDLLVRNDSTDADEQEKASIQEKEYDIILSEMMDSFIKLKREERKMILEIMREATMTVKEYSLDKAPSWIDRIISSEIAANYIYKIFATTNSVDNKLCDGGVLRYIYPKKIYYLDNKSYYYFECADVYHKNVGFVLINARDGSITTYLK